MNRKTALIIGAGVAGLGAAWWLHRIGWRCIVLERAPDLRVHGYMLGLSGPGYEVARRMGILPALNAGARPASRNFYRDRHGRELLRIDYHRALQKLDWVTLPRTTLVAALATARPDEVELRFATKLNHMTEDGGKVTAHLSDGSTLDCDLLIGADGVHSTTRNQIFGSTESMERHLGYRFAAFQVPNVLGLGEDFLSYVEPGRAVEFYSLGPDRLVTLYAWRAPETGPVPPGLRRQTLRAAFVGAHPDALRVIDELPEQDPIAFDDLTQIIMPDWYRGRRLLLGDAAHCLTLISGQGAGMALTSACLLAEELAKGDIDAALAAHSRRLRPTIDGLQQRSRKVASWFIPATPLAFRLRNIAMRLMPRQFLESYFRKVIQAEALLAGSNPI